MDNSQFYIKEFDNNYYNNFKTDYKFFKFIEYYVRTRIFDMKLLKNDMDEIQKSTEIGNVPAYKRLLTEEYWKIPDEEFLGVIEEILKDVEKGSIDLVDIVKLYAYFAYFANKKLIPYQISTLKIIFIDGMKLSANNSKYCENIDKELEKIAIDKKQEDMEDILNEYYKLNEKLKIELYSGIAEEIFKNIPMKMDEFYDKFEETCMDMPIFKYQDPRLVFQRLLFVSNEDLFTIKDKLINRVEKNGEKLAEEKENIKELKEIIDEYAKDELTSIKVVMLKEFSKGLEYILNKY